MSEREIIHLFYSHFGISPASAIPFGDDVSAIPVDDDRLAVLKTDMFVKKTDAPKGMSYRQMACKAVVSTISDLAAKGVKPLALLSSVGFPSTYSSDIVEELAKGLDDTAREYGATIIGGDTNEAEDLIIDIIGFGLINKTEITLRSGAKEGDILATTGTFGETASGLKILQENLTTDERTAASFMEKVYSPRAQLKEGLALAQSKALTSSIDSSDGLAWSLHEISRSSHVGFTVIEIPLGEGVTTFAGLNGYDPYALALYGGEEYNLIFTVEKEKWADVEKMISKVGGRLFMMGYATQQLDLVFKSSAKDVTIHPSGWEHFHK